MYNNVLLWLWFYDSIIIMLILFSLATSLTTIHLDQTKLSEAAKHGLAYHPSN